MTTYIHLAWYTFYGQFDFYNHMIMWIIGLNDNCGEYLSPFSATISWNYNSIVLPKYVFLFTGALWNIMIVSAIRRRAKKYPDIIDFNPVHAPEKEKK